MKDGVHTAGGATDLSSRDRARPANAPLLAALCFGLAAVMIAVACGVPAWRTWIPGDAAMIGVMVGFGVYWTLRSLRP